MSTELAVETLLGSDPEFAMMAEALYGPQVSAAEIHSDVFGLGQGLLTDLDARLSAVEKSMLGGAAALTRDTVTASIKDLHRGAVIGAKRAKLWAGVREPLHPMAPGEEPKLGQSASERGQRMGATVKNPLKIAQRYPKTALAGAATVGAVAEHKHNTKPVTYDQNTGLYKRDGESKTQRTLRQFGLGATVAGAGLGVGELGEQLAKPEHFPRAAKLVKPLMESKVGTGLGMLKRPKVAAGLAGTMLAGDLAASHALKKPGKVAKNDFVAEGTFSKFDDDKRLAFGWASVVEKNGLPVLDRQGDYITADDLEDAAYRYVLSSRVGGDMHKRAGVVDRLDDRPHKVSDLVESFVITKEKIAKMGLPPSTPIGWWVGFKVHDDDTWSEVRKGGRTGFSIHGRGKRADLDIDSLMGMA